MIEILKSKKRKQQEEIERNRNHELLALITPMGMKFGVSSLYLGENLCCVYAVKRFPGSPSVGWLSRLTNIPDTVVSITSLPLDQGYFIQSMNKKISESNSAAETTRDALERARNLKTAEDSQKIMISVDQGTEAIGGYSLQIMVFGRNKEEFDRKCARVESTASALGAVLMKLSHRQKEAYMHLSPTYPDQQIINEKIERPLPISAFTGGYPYAKSEICDRGGYYLGKTDTGGIILFDPWKRTKSRTNSKCICLDTKSVISMGGGVLAAQYFNILSWCWQEISKSKKERVMLIADECWMLIDPSCPQSMVFLRNAEKRARKYEGSVVVSTQQIVDFLAPQISFYGQPVLDTPSIKLIFGMRQQGLLEVKDIFSLNQMQSQFVEAQIRGAALMCVGADKFRINFDLSKERLKMFGTGGGR